MTFRVLKTMAPSFKTMTTGKARVIQIAKHKSIDSISNIRVSLRKALSVNRVVRERIMANEIDFLTFKLSEESSNCIASNKTMYLRLIHAAGTHDPKFTGPQAVRFNVYIPILVVVLRIGKILYAHTSMSALPPALYTLICSSVSGLSLPVCSL